MPSYSVKVEVFVDGFEEILFNDIVTMKIVINRNEKETEEKVIR